MSQADYDSPWKEILDKYLQKFLNLFYSSLHEDIDWNKGYQSLDKELAKIAPGAESGNCIADKVFEVSLKNGTVTTLLIHIEVQGEWQEHFAKRMYVYDYRLFDHYQLPTISIAVLTDTHPNWRPSSYHWQMHNNEKLFRFHSVKLLDYIQTATKQSKQDLFKVLIYVHFEAKACANDDKNRFQGKFKILRYILSLGLQSEEVRQLIRFIDWAMQLPRELDKKLYRKLNKIEQEGKMQYVSSWERMWLEEGIEKGIEQGIEKGIEKGIRQGLEKGVEQGLQAERKALTRQADKKFGWESGEQLAGYLAKIKNTEQFEPIFDSIIEINDAAEFLAMVKKVISTEQLQ